MFCREYVWEFTILLPYREVGLLQYIDIYIYTAIPLSMLVAL